MRPLLQLPSRGCLLQPLQDSSVSLSIHQHKACLRVGRTVAHSAFGKVSFAPLPRSRFARPKLARSSGAFASGARACCASSRGQSADPPSDAAVGSFSLPLFLSWPLSRLSLHQKLHRWLLGSA